MMVRAYLFTTCLLLAGYTATSQIHKNSNDVLLVKEIKVGEYQGMKYTFTSAIKNIPDDSLHMASLFALQVKNNDYDFIVNSMQQARAIENDTIWHTYTFSGTIDSTAKKIWLYFSSSGNGNFYFDSAFFNIYNSSGIVKNIQLIDPKIKNISGALKGFKNKKPIRKNANIKISLGCFNDIEHKNAIHIFAAGGRDTVITVYGENATAGKYFVSSGVKMYYEVYGNGKPLILLHGNGGSISSFAAQIAEFEKYFTVYALDTRGQGKSIDTVTEKFTYDLFADDVKVFLDSLHLKQVNLLGWSDGGNTGLVLAMKHPEYVKNLVVMGANLNPSDTAVSSTIIKQVKKDIKKLKSKNNSSNQVIIRLLEMLLAEPNIATEELKHITAATLVLAGEHDLVLLRHTKIIAAAIPNATLHIINKETHFVPEENPTAFNRVVLDFLLPLK